MRCLSACESGRAPCVFWGKERKKRKANFFLHVQFNPGTTPFPATYHGRKNETCLSFPGGLFSQHPQTVWLTEAARVLTHRKLFSLHSFWYYSPFAMYSLANTVARKFQWSASACLCRRKRTETPFSRKGRELPASGAKSLQLSRFSFLFFSMCLSPLRAGKSDASLRPPLPILTLCNVAS